MNCVRDLKSSRHKRLHKICLATLLITFSTNLFSSEVNFQWDWMISAQTSTPHKTTFTTSSEDLSSKQTINALLDVQIDYQAFSSNFSVKGKDIYHSEDDLHAEAEFIVTELFWQDSIELLDYSLDMQLGKTRVDWGVGYGYRPLDVFSTYRRNPMGIQVEEGVGVVAISYFDALGEWTLIYTNSGLNQQEGSEIIEESEQQGAGLRRYGLIADTEYQVFAYYDDIRKGLLGGSLVTVIDRAWEFHGSAIYQQNYLFYSQPDKSMPPVSLTTEQQGYQGLAGLTWADSIGNTLIFEYWYDSRPWSKKQWDTAISNGSPSYEQGYLHSNLVQHNVMLHWSLDSSAWKNWQWSQDSWLKDVTPAVDLQYSPEDNGIIATQWLSYLIHESQQASIEAQLVARIFSGSSDSAYANMANKQDVLLNLKGRF